MFTNKRILAIGSHPDDIEYYALGTLLKYKEVSKIFCYIATCGGENDKTTISTRGMESIKALKDALAPIEVHIEHREGLHLMNYVYYVTWLDKIIQKFNIDTIFTHSPHDTHQDHRLLHDITLTACRRFSGTILCYGTISQTIDFQPRVFVDITDYMIEKLKALACHVSQKDKVYMQPEYIGDFHAVRDPVTGKRKYVEKFDLIKYCC
uniref:Putative N-acetylglucosaminylphosphatidylinositol de-N-acetylase n=1 Tax=viral metagenome TaxID=1070528 RepID=A0A6M3K2E7_9ZZZZ